MSIGVKMSIKDKYILKRGNCCKNLKKQMNKRGKISFRPKIIMFCYFSLLFLSFLNAFQTNVFQNRNDMQLAKSQIKKNWKQTNITKLFRPIT